MRVSERERVCVCVRVCVCGADLAVDTCPAARVMTAMLYSPPRSLKASLSESVSVEPTGPDQIRLD